MSRWTVASMAAGCLLLGMPAQGRGQTCSVEWRLTERLRIGSLDGNDALSEVRSLTIGPEGDLYVTQYLRGEVTVFSPAGELVRTIGRSGQGPGEFERSPSRAGWYGDTLWIADQFRAQSFTRDGSAAEFVRFQVPVPSESARYTPDLPLADGSFWGNRWLVPTLGATPYGQDTRTVSFRRFSASGEVLGTIAAVDVSGRFVQVSDAPAYEEHPLLTWLPGSFFGAPEQNMTHDRSSIVLLGEVREESDGGSFEIVHVSLGGDTISRWSVDYDPIPVDASETEWMRDQYSAYHAGDFTDGVTGYLQTDPATKSRRRAYVSERFWMPAYHPPVREIVVGSDDTVFILRELTLPTRTDRWEAYSLDGTLLGRFSVSGGRSSRLPWAPRLRILQASQTDVWATTIDELEVPYLHRFTVSDACGENGST